MFLYLTELLEMKFWIVPKWYLCSFVFLAIIWNINLSFTFKK